MHHMVPEHTKSDPENTMAMIKENSDCSGGNFGIRRDIGDIGGERSWHW